MFTCKYQSDGEDFVNFCGLLRKHEPCSCRGNKLEQLEFKFEKIIGI